MKSLLLAVTLATSPATSQDPKPKPEEPKKAGNPVTALKEAAEAPTPLEQMTLGFSLFYPKQYAAAVKGEQGMLELRTRASMLLQAESCLKAELPADAREDAKSLHARFKAHPDALRSVLGVLETVDGAPVKYIVPKMKPHEVPFAVMHAMGDEKSPWIGVLVCIYLERESDTSKTKPDERMKNLARTIALPASLQLMAGAQELGLEQVGVMILQPCRDPAAAEADAVKAEMILCVFPIAELMLFQKKTLAESEMLPKALVYTLPRGERQMTRSTIFQR